MLGMLESFRQQVRGLSCRDHDEVGAEQGKMEIRLKSSAWNGHRVAGVSEGDREALLSRLEFLCEQADEFSPSERLKERLIVPIRSDRRPVTKNDLHQIEAALCCSSRVAYEQLLDWMETTIHPLVVGSETGQNFLDPRLVDEIVAQIRGQLHHSPSRLILRILPRVLDRTRSALLCNASFVEAARRIANENGFHFFAPSMKEQERITFNYYRGLFPVQELSDEDLFLAITHHFLEGDLSKPSGVAPILMRRSVDLDRVRAQLRELRSRPSLSTGVNAPVTNEPLQREAFAFLTDEVRLVKDVLVGSQFTNEQGRDYATQIVDRNLINIDALRSAITHQEKRDLVLEALTELQIQLTVPELAKDDITPSLSLGSSLNPLNTMPDHSSETHRIREGLGRLATPEIVDALDREGLIEYELMRIYESEGCDDERFLQYLHNQQVKYREYVGPLPGDSPERWNRVFKNFIEYHPEDELSPELFRTLTVDLCKICSEPSISREDKLLAASVYSERFLTRIPVHAKRRSIIDPIITEVESYSERVGPMIVRPLVWSLSGLIPQEMPEEYSQLVDVTPQVGSLGRQFEAMLLRLARYYSLQDSEVEIIRQLAPKNINSKEFDRQLHCWAILRELDCPLSFGNFMFAISRGLVGERLLTDLASVWSDWRDNGPSKAGLRRVREAGAPIVRAWCRSQPGLADASDETLGQLTTLNCWSRRLKPDLDALLTLRTVHSVLFDRSMTVDDALFAVSEHLVTPRDQERVLLYGKSQIERLEELRKLSVTDFYVRTIGKVAEVGECDAELPGVKTLKMCNELVKYSKNPESYCRHHLRGDRERSDRLDSCLLHLGLKTVQSTMRDPSSLKKSISDWCQLSSDEQQTLFILVDALKQFVAAQKHEANLDFSWFGPMSPIHREFMKTVLVNLGLQHLPGMAAQMQQYRLLLDAVELTCGFVDRIQQRRNLQSSYNRAFVNDLLRDMFQVRLGEKTVPDGSCGFHAIASITGDSPVEVRRRCAIAARDIQLFIDTADTRRLSRQDTPYLERVRRAARDQLQPRGGVPFESTPGERAAYLDHPLEHLDVPKGRTAEDYWLDTEDLRFVAVAYGRPCIHIENLLTQSTGMVPVSYFYGEHGERIMLDGNISRASRVLSQRDMIGLVNLGGNGWQHWEPLEPLSDNPQGASSYGSRPVMPKIVEKTGQGFEPSQKGGRSAGNYRSAETVETDPPVAPRPKPRVKRYLQTPRQRPDNPVDAAPLLSQTCKLRMESGAGYIEENPLLENIDEEIQQYADEVRRMTQPPTDEEMFDETAHSWVPYDPNLDCVGCGKKHRIGDIQKLRRHLNEFCPSRLRTQNK